MSLALSENKKPVILTRNATYHVKIISLRSDLWEVLSIVRRLEPLIPRHSKIYGIATHREIDDTFIN